MNPAIRFIDYGFTYASGDKPALSNVSLDLAAGRVTSVIAGQGAGKTTLLRAAAGLLGEIYNGTVTGSLDFPVAMSQPTAVALSEAKGKTPVAKSLAATPSLRSGRQRSCAAFFDGYVQVTLAVETVREELGLPLFATGINRVERDTRAVAVAHELGISHLLDRNVTQLSGGEEKLVGIAAALVPDVPIHVLDEPFEQLDVAHFAAVIRAIKMRARRGRLVLVATSALDVALNIADEALVFADGRWSTIDAPTYADLAQLATIGESPVMTFLSNHHSDPVGVRRFRDAVRHAS